MLTEIPFDLVKYETDSEYRAVIYWIIYVLFKYQGLLIEKQFGDFTSHIITDNDICAFMYRQNVTRRQAIEALNSKRTFEIMRDQSRR